QHDHDDFVTFSVDLPNGLDQKTLLARINAVIESHDILRLKGFAHIPDTAARLLIQAVGPRLNSYFDRPWHENEKRQTRLVVIGEKAIDQMAIAAALHG
ncbi:MAG TPA: GTP-binding protein, partial [Aestuariivirga sp.]